MCGRTCSRRRVALTAAQRAIETATQAQSYLFEKPDNVVPSLGSVENELPPVYTEVWDEKNQSARDVGYGTGSQVGQSSDIQGQQASISGYDSRITTAKMAIFAWYMQRKDERRQRRLAYGYSGCCGLRC